MKKISHILSVALLLLATTFSSLTSLPVQAATQGTKTVTLHKLLIVAQDYWSSSEITSFTTPDGYDGSQNIDQFNALLKAANRGSVKEIEGVYFALQNEAGNWINKAGQEVATVDQAYGMLTSPTGAVFDTSQLPAGKYKIVELHDKSTYAGTDKKDQLTLGRAVPVELTLPMLKENGTTIEHGHVYPKNLSNEPELEKRHNRVNLFGKDAFASLGSPVDYSIRADIPEGIKYQHLSFTDTMDEGLTLTKNAFNAKVYIATRLAEGVPQFEEGADKDYTVIYPTERSFELTFTQKGLDKLKAWVERDNQYFTIRYTAYVNANAVKAETQVNTVTMRYGNNPNVLLEKTAKVDLKVLNAKFVKKDGQTNERLPLAEFLARTTVTDPADSVSKEAYLSWKPVTGYGIQAEEAAKINTLREKQTAFHRALDTYQALTKTQKENPAEKQKVLDAKTAFDEAFSKAHVSYVWDTDKANPNRIRLVSNDKGQIQLVGYLYDVIVVPFYAAIDHAKVETFHLEEVVAPVGYSRLTQPIQLNRKTKEVETGIAQYESLPIWETDLPKVAYDDDNADAGEAYLITNVKLSIPQTGGMGVALFLLVGGAVMAYAFYKYRKASDEEAGV